MNTEAPSDWRPTYQRLSAVKRQPAPRDNNPHHPKAEEHPAIYHPAKNTGKLGAIRNALKPGPANTQQIAAATKLPLRAIQQNLQTMRRRFQVVRSLDGQWMLTTRGRAYTSEVD